MKLTAQAKAGFIFMPITDKFHLYQQLWTENNVQMQSPSKFDKQVKSSALGSEKQKVSSPRSS